MVHITLPLFATICFMSAAYGIRCSAGPGHRFPITCPGVLNSTKSYCCEINGSFQCCDEEEFARQEEKNDDTKSLAYRNKRDADDVVGAAAGLGVLGILGIIIAALFPFILCCCCCCACCPCYACCHPNNATNVTIVQPSGGATPGNVQNNFSVSVPTQPGMQQQYTSVPGQQPPPQYNQGGYDQPAPLGFVQ